MLISLFRELILFVKAGAFFGVLLISWLSDKYGRKTAFIYCAVLSLFGGTLLCASQNPAMFIVFRFFAGAGSWGFLCVSKYIRSLLVFDFPKDD